MVVTNWILTETARTTAERMGVGEKEAIITCENPDWVYDSEVFAGAKVALGGRLAVVHDETSKIVIHLSWRHNSWKKSSTP
jgi:hypothetical protein